MTFQQNGSLRAEDGVISLAFAFFMNTSPAETITRRTSLSCFKHVHPKKAFYHNKQFFSQKHVPQ